MGTVLAQQLVQSSKQMSLMLECTNSKELLVSHIVLRLLASCTTVQSPKAAPGTATVILVAWVHGSLGQTHRISLFAWGFRGGLLRLGITLLHVLTCSPACLGVGGQPSYIAIITANITSTEPYKICGQSIIQWFCKRVTSQSVRKNGKGVHRPVF